MQPEDCYTPEYLSSRLRDYVPTLERKDFEFGPHPLPSVIGTGPGQLGFTLAAGSSSLDLVGALVGADVVLGLGVGPDSPIHEGGAEDVAIPIQLSIRIKASRVIPLDRDIV